MKQITLKNGEILTIERIQVSDAAEVVLYQNKVGGESDNLTFGKNEFHINLEDEIKFIQNMDTNGTGQIFLGKIDGKIVASINAAFNTKKRLDHLAGCGITVAQEKWGLGIGGALMEYLIHYLTVRGDIRVLHLEVRSDNLSAKNLYRKMGFEKVGTHKGYLHVGENYFDVDIMEKYFY